MGYEDNRVSLYQHPVAVFGGGIGKMFTIDYQPMKKTLSLLLSQLHSPVRVSMMKDGLSDVRNLVYDSRTRICV